MRRERRRNQSRHPGDHEVQGDIPSAQLALEAGYRSMSERMKLHIDTNSYQNMWSASSPNSL
jgi:hypothetical protein